MNNNFKKVYIVSTNLCIQSMAQASQLSQYFEMNNYKLTTDFRKADLIIIDTCAFSKVFEDLAIEKIVQIQSEKRSDAKIIVSGCLPAINKERLAEVFTGCSVSNDKLDSIKTLFDFPISLRDASNNILYRRVYSDRSVTNKAIRKVVDTLSFIEHHSSNNVRVFLRHLLRYDYGRHSFYIKIGSGCSGNCTYCAIRYAKGSLKSRPLEEIRKEFKIGLEKGYNDFVLLGDDMGSYGKDIGLNIIVVLEEMLKIKGDYKIALSYFNPRHLIDMFSPLKEIFKSNRISFMLCPVQSGNNRILKLMNRGCRAEDYIKYIKELQRDVPNMIIRNHILVGFPGETDEEFNDSLRLIYAAGNSENVPFVYTDRPGTPASAMDNKISEHIKIKRYLHVKSSALFNKALYNFKYLRGVCSGKIKIT